MSMYQNPANGYTEKVSTNASWFWCLLFGTLYFMFNGIWKHAIISLFLSLLTGGISWLIYPFFVYGIIDAHYQRLGWVKLEE